MGGLCGGGSGGVGSANTPNDGDKNPSKNSLKENLANFFTPGDNMEYRGGKLVNVDSSGASTGAAETGAKTWYGTVGQANDPSNDNPNMGIIGDRPSSVQPRTFTQEDLGALTTVNSKREDLANIFTPFDGAKYVNGNLIDETTGQSLTGGGYATNKLGQKDYIYGVSDDFSNNAKPDRGGMSQKDYTLALAKQSMLQNIPPSNPEYFGSWGASLAVPIIGGYVGSKMLEGGINDRRAMMDQHQAALDAGAKPDMSDGVYRGYFGDDGFVPYVENKKQDPMTDASIGALNMGNDGNDGNQYSGYTGNEVGMGGGTVVPLSELTQPERMTSYDPTPMDPDTIVYASPLYEKFQSEVLPGIQQQMPNMTKEDIDEAFRIYRDRQNSVVAN